jgi:hypothetical protein
MTATPSPPRLVVLTSTTAAVYNGRKLVAYSAEPYEYTAHEVEEMRVADYTEEKAS